VKARSEWLTIAALLCASLAAIAFVVFYVAVPDNQLLGLALGLAFAFLAVAAIVAGKRVVPQDKADSEYHDFGDDAAQQEVVATAAEGAKGISRRKLIFGATATAGLTLGAAAAVPLASLGPNVGEQVYATPWRRGRRLVKENGDPLRADEVVYGTFFTAFPEGADPRDIGSPVILVRVPVERLDLPDDRRRGAPDGVIAFSKICPHAGCAVSMYRHPKYEGAGAPEDALVCPCHYSTFDPARGGALLFGPAGRDLPQLPLEVGSDGVLAAAGDFYTPPGPSYGGIRLES
jgi:quinol---cytochrome c reductase iron-sulfur subunit